MLGAVRHPMDVTTVELTDRRPDDRPQDHENFVFVTDGIEAAVAKGDGACRGQGRRCQWRADGPAVPGGGACSTRSVSSWCRSCWAGTPLFAELGATRVQFEGPVAVVEGTGVTHLRYRAQK
jgi:hypothetical protein